MHSEKELKKIAERKYYKLPQIGDVIVYNEIHRFCNKHPPLPYRGVGIAIACYGVNFVIKELRPNNHRFNFSITADEIQLGLYRYKKLKHLPASYPGYENLDLQHLSKELQDLVL